MQSLFLLPDWIASVQNSVAWSTETWISPSHTFWKPQGTSWQFASTENSHPVLATVRPVPTTAHDTYEGTRSQEGSFFSRPERGGATQAPVSAWHLLWRPSGGVPKLRQILMLFYLVLIFAVFSHYTICILDKRTTKSFALIPLGNDKTPRHKNTTPTDLNSTHHVKMHAAYLGA